MKSMNLGINNCSGLNWHVSIYEVDKAPTLRLQHCPDCESKLALDPQDEKGFSYFTIEFATRKDWNDFVDAVLTMNDLFQNETSE